MSYRELAETVGIAVDALGVVLIVLGIVVALALFGARFARRTGGDVYGKLRQDLGRAILLGLEILVAADIIRTVAVEPTIDGVVVLAGIVLIRTFLSFALEVELSGRWPWQRAANERRGVSG